MVPNQNDAFDPNDVQRTAEHNRVDDIRQDEMLTSTGSTDDASTTQSDATELNKMATGVTATLQDQTAGGHASDAGTTTDEYADDREAVRRSVDEDAEKDTGRPTGAIYGHDFDIKAVRGFNEAKGESAASQTDEYADDREAVKKSVDEDAEKDTGRPTGAIYGHNFDIITVQDPSKRNDEEDK